MPIREKLTTAATLDPAETRLATKPKSKSDDDDRGAFGAAFAAMLPSAPSVATASPGRLTGSPTQEVAGPEAAGETESKRDSAALPADQASGVGAASTARRSPALSGARFTVTTSPSEVTATASAGNIWVAATDSAAQAAPAMPTRPGFWSGLLRAADLLLAAARPEARAILTPHSQSDAKVSGDSVKQPAKGAIIQAEGNEPTASQGRNGADGGQAASDRPNAWMQLVETTAPLSQVPLLIAKLSNQLSRPLPTAAANPAAPSPEDPADDAPAGRRVAATSDHPTLESASGLAAGHRAATSNPRLLAVTTGQPLATTAPAERPSPAASRFEPAAETTASAPSATEPASSTPAPAGPGTTAHGDGALVATAPFTPAVPAAPHQAQAVTAPRSVAPPAQVHPSAPSSNLPAPSRTASLRLDLFQGASAHANVRERAGVVDVQIVTNNPSLAQHLNSELGALRRDFNASGLHLQSADVSYSGQDGGGRSSHEGEQQAAPRGDKAAPGVTFGLGEVGK